MKMFSVTVKVEGNPDYTIRVAAADEWKARTKAMMGYPHKLRGQEVRYEVGA